MIDCLLEHGANTTVVNNLTLSVLEHIMVGESRSKSTYLRRLASTVPKWQLNRALWHSFNNGKRFLGILVECGADPNYVGLSVDDFANTSQQEQKLSESLAETENNANTRTPQQSQQDTGITKERPSPAEDTGLKDHEDYSNITSGTNSSQIGEQLGDTHGQTVVLSPPTSHGKGRQYTVDPENCPGSDEEKIAPSK